MIFLMWEYFYFFYAGDVARSKASDRRKRKRFNLSLYFHLSEDSLKGIRGCFDWTTIRFIKQRSIIFVHMRVNMWHHFNFFIEIER